MQKHAPESRDSRSQSNAIDVLAAIRDGFNQSIGIGGSCRTKESTSLPLGGMTKARVQELTRLAGSDTFTHSPSFGPEPVVGFGGLQGPNAR